MFAPLWNSSDIAERQQIALQIADLNPDFAKAYQQLKQGQVYTTAVTRGFVEWQLPNNIAREPHYCLVFIPYHYTPTQKYTVKVFLHGLVSTKNKQGCIHKFIDTQAATYEHRNYISVYPAGFKTSPWWAESQLENLANILAQLKQQYNIDENRVHLAGMSDGGTGAYYMANTCPTLWASFFPYLANIAGLNALSQRQIYVSNFKNRPFLIVNGEKDHVFPPKIVIPYAELLRKAGIDMDFYMLENAGHNMDWFPAMKSKVIEFITTHPRQPLPDQLYWETETVDKHARVHWLIIDKLTKESENTDRLVSVNTILNYHNQMFRRDKVSGRVRAQKNGNEVVLTSDNVSEVTILCSPAHFDFAHPVRVIANQQVVFDKILSPSITTLLKWHAIDNDRTMLFGAEIKVKIA
ncbi:dienelactone hydrolase family protein [Microscilla marina]|uniref:Dienelactone hydrolase domain-containing protein n=1 Tax=Microscilla marina ATCC 23134 TaxID=313606 RepID=A1ZRK7_MICM2|nr:dienelactone hydrolase family protein [Microscilla marina]EAY26912.1 hypothetical protein M23134_03563 [Microscilla marina ATCC 23134]